MDFKCSMDNKVAQYHQQVDNLVNITSSQPQLSSIKILIAGKRVKKKGRSSFKAGEYIFSSFCFVH